MVRKCELFYYPNDCTRVIIFNIVIVVINDTSSFICRR